MTQLDLHAFVPYGDNPYRCAHGTGDSCPWPPEHRVHFPAIHDGPEVDGRSTWFCRFADVPEGYEWRPTADSPTWIDGDSSTSVGAHRFVQIREHQPGPSAGDALLVGRLGLSAGNRFEFGQIRDAAFQAAPPGMSAADAYAMAEALWRALERLAYLSTS